MNEVAALCNGVLFPEPVVITSVLELTVSVAVNAEQT